MKLLVSVRSAAEAALALEAGVDLLDIKEPLSGSLGAASPQVCREIVGIAKGRVPLSAACGELVDLDCELHATDFSWAEGLAHAKVGLANMAAVGNWPAVWQRFAAALPRRVRPVAVAYADFLAARSPTVDEVLDEAIKLRWNALLIDTFDKRGGQLFDHLTSDRIGEIVQRTRAAGMLTLMAGSLDLESVKILAELVPAPDFVAVRGAVCEGNRESSIASDKIVELKRCLNPANCCEHGGST